MNYTIGEFAEILGVTTDTLRLYEKHGIIKPEKDSKNNYRYFYDLDARDLLMSRWYRSMDIPLRDVVTLIKDSSLNDIKEKIIDKQQYLDEEIRKHTLLLNKIIEINKNLKYIESSVNKCVIKKMSGIYRLKQTDRNSLLNDDYLKDMVNTWMELLPFTFYSFRIGKNNILSDEDHLEYDWGLAIYEDELPAHELVIDKNVEYISPYTCLSSVILPPYGEDHINRDSLRFMIDFIAENHYMIVGDIIGKILVTEKVNNQSKTYLEVNIPIESCSMA